MLASAQLWTSGEGSGKTGASLRTPELSMNNSLQAPELENLRWGTMMPIALRIGSQFVQVRARGSYTLLIQDRSRFQSQIADPHNLRGQVGTLIVNAFTEVIGELSQTVSGVAQITGATASVTRSLCEKLEPTLAGLGLRMKTLTVDTIEKM
jgi:membrane protease subunit (stomatin/prohibitin family)